MITLDFFFRESGITKFVLHAIVYFSVISLIFPLFGFSLTPNIYGQVKGHSPTSFKGVDMKGLYTSILHGKRSSTFFPDNYYNQSFKLITSAGMNHIRYVLYWQAYENDPVSFMDELQSVASLADKWGLHVIYDNHQYHTSSWLDPVRGSGFPLSLFNDNASYPYGSGGAPTNSSASKWWTKWWNNAIIDNRGLNGWALQVEFLQNIIKTVENHTSTLGYEILNEPQIHSVDQWEKIGKYNTFMANELRKMTNKTLVFDMAIPLQIHNLKINATSENMLKMLPQNYNNILFKISLYGIPTTGSYQEQKLNLLRGVSNQSGVPLYIGEWNDLSTEERNDVETQDVKELIEDVSDLNQTDANIMTKKLKEIGAWGWAFWNWNYLHDSTPDFNLITVSVNGELKTTKYFEILKNAIANS